MDVFEALYTTRAMRRVTEEPIPDEILKQMVDAAVRAPSGANNQGWKFIVVTESNIKIYLETFIEKLGTFISKSIMKIIQIWVRQKC